LSQWFEMLAQFQAGLTPPVALSWLLPFQSQSVLQSYQRKGDWELPMGIVGIAIWALLAALVWLAVVRRFRQVSGRVPLPPRLGPPLDVAPVEVVPLAGSRNDKPHEVLP
jgi:hypothetical protein